MSAAHRADTPVLITEAQPSFDDELAARRRRYTVMMSLRIPCLVAAAVTYQMWQLWWLSLIILGLSIPLPWMAVLIANDRPAKKREPVNRFQRASRTLEASEHQVIEGSPRDS